MSDSESVQIVQQVLSVLDRSGQSAISSYTQWHFAKAISYILLGLVIIVSCVRWNHLDDDGEHKIDGFAFYLKIFAIFIGMLFIVANVPDLFSPQAIAIHQLIKDIKS